jgi:hypothetical protein
LIFCAVQILELINVKFFSPSFGIGISYQFEFVIAKQPKRLVGKPLRIVAMKRGVVRLALAHLGPYQRQCRSAKDASLFHFGCRLIVHCFAGPASAQIVDCFGHWNQFLHFASCLDRLASSLLLEFAHSAVRD